MGVLESVLFTFFIKHINIITYSSKYSRLHVFERNLLSDAKDETEASLPPPSFFWGKRFFISISLALKMFGYFYCSSICLET